MSDLRIEPLFSISETTGQVDIAIIDQGDAVVQRVLLALRLELGGYDYDLDAGVPYQLLAKPANIDGFQAAIRDILTQIPGVASINGIDTVPNPAIPRAFITNISITTPDQITRTITLRSP